MVMPSGAIVVGIDRSADSRRGVDWAAAAARSRGAPLHLLHAIPPPVTELLPTAGESLAMHEEAELLLTDVRAWLAPSGVHAITTEIVDRHPVPALVEASRQAGIVVVGARGQGAASGLLLGSVSQHISRHAHCPVVVARERADPHERRIVVGVDGSAASDQAIGFAIETAARDGAPLVAVHGWKDHPVAAFGRGSPAWSATLHRVETGERLLRDAVGPWAATYPDVAITYEAVPAHPARLLADFSDHAALLVVGSRGHTELADLLLGSVSQSVLHHAHCPVAVVR